MKKTLHSLKTKFRDSSTSNQSAKVPTSEILSSTLNAAETSIRLLKELSDTVPFLGGAASATIFIIEQCRKSVRNSEDFEDLSKSLQNLSSLTSPDIGGDLVLSPQVTESVKEFDGAISNIRSEVESLLSSNRLSRLVNASENEARVTSLIKRVKDAIERIMLASLLDVSRGMEKIVLAQSLLSLNPVHSTQYNCVDRDQCLDGTRVSVLDDIQKWFDTGEEQIYWLNGAAGMGKTTIALSVAHRLVAEGRVLMGTFFCSRESVDRKNSALIFPTLACQLAGCNREYQDALVDVLARFPYVGSALPHEQVQRLIVDPLKKVHSSKAFALVIDALDECNGERASEKVLLALLQHMASAPSLKVFVSCRPAAYVETLLSFGEHRRMFKLHQVPAGIVDSDLRLFYHQRLEQIRIAKRIETEGWPPEVLVEKLVERAAGLFIFAVTVCKYADSRGDVKRRLEYIADLPMSEHKDALSVDILYTEVLSAALEKIPDERDCRDFARVLATVMLAQEVLTVDALGQLLDIETSVIYDLLRDVHPILFVPDETGTLMGEVIHTFHASFPDYMTASDRVGVKVPLMYINPAEHHSEMALCCLRCMNKELKRILPFTERFFANNEIQGLDLLVQTHISKALHYAALYWADHLSSATWAGLQISDILEELQLFASVKLLFWLECISLLQAARNALWIIVKGRDWLQVNCLPFYVPTLELLQDVYHAINESFEIIQNFAVHVYISFILFLPQGTSLYRHYLHHLPPNWKVTGHLPNTWNPLIRYADGVCAFSDLISFSPDERYIVSTDSTLITVDILSGIQGGLLPPFSSPPPTQSTWHAEMIPGVDAAFPSYSSAQPCVTSAIWLPSEAIVTCCTILTAAEEPYRCHCFVSLWDSETGVHKQLVFQATEEMNMFLPVLVTSPSFRYLGLSIPSAQIFWDTGTWEKISSVPSSTPFYRCFAMSDTFYMSGSEIWEITGASTAQGSLAFVPQHVTSAQFTRDGQGIILGLISGLVEIWSIPLQTKTVTHQLPLSWLDPLERLPSIAVSPAEDLIAVAYGSGVDLFHLKSNASLQLARRFQMPRLVSSMLTAATFSTSGQYLACHDEMGSVYVWTTAKAVLAQISGNDSPSVLRSSGAIPCSVTYMANNRFAVTGNADGSVSQWDCNTGLLIQTCKVSDHAVRAIAASSDGKFLACLNQQETSIWSLSNMGFKLDIEVNIPVSPEIKEYDPYTYIATFNSESTMVAIATGFVADIWKLTESDTWQRFTQFKMPMAKLSLYEDVSHSGDLTDDGDFLLEAWGFNHRWLVNHYHGLKTSSPYPVVGEVAGQQSEQATQDHIAPFRWWRLPEVTKHGSSFSHCQLYFSLDDQYILTPTGIYEIATGQECINYMSTPPGLIDALIQEHELKKFWKDEKEHYKRNGVLKTLHPPKNSNGWIADTEGRRTFWVPQRLIRNPLQSGPWYSCASEDDHFAFISEMNSTVVFVNVPGAGVSGQT